MHRCAILTDRAWPPAAACCPGARCWSTCWAAGCSACWPACCSPARLGPRWAALAGTGVCGALTTFSTFGYETVRLAEEGSGVAAVANVAANVTGGLVAVTLGWMLGGWLG